MFVMYMYISQQWQCDIQPPWSLVTITKHSKITFTNKGWLSIIKLLGGMGCRVQLRDIPSPWESG